MIKKIFSSGIVFLHYKSHFPEKWGAHAPAPPGSYSTEINDIIPFCHNGVLCKLDAISELSKFYLTNSRVTVHFSFTTNNFVTVSFNSLLACNPLASISLSAQFNVHST